MLQIEKSVGLGGANAPIDVAIVQCLVKRHFTETVRVKGRSVQKKGSQFNVDGENSQELIERIKEFQEKAAGMKRPDGRVDPRGRTFNKLVAALKCNNKSPKELLFGPNPSNTGILKNVDAKRFRRYFPKEIGSGLTVSKGEDLLGFFAMLKNDPEIEDVRWAAYMLATVYVETGYSFKPIGEKGKGGDSYYGKIKKVVVDSQGYRGEKGATYTNIYYGRGYCQLTHWQNYKRVGKAIGLGDELYINPEKAKEKKIAYDIISKGMRDGLFTKGIHKLNDHINGSKCDYLNARRIINGTDRWKEIANYAENIEMLLRLSIQPRLVVNNEHLFHLC